MTDTPTVPGVPDRTVHPWAEATDGTWHRRPTDGDTTAGNDPAPRRAAHRQVATVCGQVVSVVRVSNRDPRHDTADDDVVTTCEACCGRK